MNKHIDMVQRGTAPAVVVFKNMPTALTEDGAAEFLWQKTGMNIEPNFLSVVGTTCLAVLTRECIADFLDRSLRNTVHIFCHAATKKGERMSRTSSGPKSNR
jgi:hypothetical protein